MKVSACWITKNERFNLVKSINSISELADELIVVDTGSTDDTVETAEKLGAKVYHFEWINDFSAARNYALDQANGDVVFFLDSDEWFEPERTKEDVQILERIFSNPDICALDILLHNVDEFGNIINNIYNFRAFRNNCIHYINQVHEIPERLDNKILVSYKMENWNIIHSGYNFSIAKDKAKRNIEILENAQYDNKFYETARKFYLIRERRNTPERDKSLPYLNEFLRNKNLLVKLQHYPVLICEFFNISMDFAFKMRSNVSRREIYNSIVKRMPELLPDYPGTEIIELVYMLLFAYDEEVFLKKLKAYENKPVDESLFPSTIYKTDFFNIYSKGTDAANMRNDKESAFKYLINSFINAPALYDTDNITSLLHSFEGMSEPDIANFIMKIIKPDSRTIMESIVESCMYERYKNLYFFFFKKQMEAGTATKSRFLFLNVLLGKYDEAVNAVLENKDELSEEDISSTLFRAVICSNNKSLYLKCKEYLKGYKRILDCWFSYTRIESPTAEEMEIFVREYSIIAFAAGTETADNLFMIVSDGRDIHYRVKCEYYLNGGLYSQFLDEEGDEAPFGINYGARIALIRCCLGAGRYERAFELLNEIIDASFINYDIINGLSLISAMTEGQLKMEARELYELYSPILEEVIDLDDVIKTGVVFDDISKKDLQNLTVMTPQKFDLILSQTPVVTFEPLREKLLKAAHIYEEKGFYGMAEMCYRRLLAGENYESVLFDSLERVYRQLGNEKVADKLMQRKAIPQSSTPPYLM